MTEPDEALLWAREQAKQLREAPNNPTRDLSAEIDAGKHDDELSDMAYAYRAGAAASADRIKALEARAEELEWALLGMTAAAQNHLHDSAKQHNLQVALKVLKESDQ